VTRTHREIIRSAQADEDLIDASAVISALLESKFLVKAVDEKVKKHTSGSTVRVWFSLLWRRLLVSHSAAARILLDLLLLVFERLHGEAETL